MRTGLRHNRWGWYGVRDGSRVTMYFETITALLDSLKR